MSKRRKRPTGPAANWQSSDLGMLGKLWRVGVNVARRARPGHPHDCCGNYGEPGC